MSTAEPSTSNERRMVLQRRADLRLARLERVVEAMGRRRSSVLREVVLGAKVLGLAVGGVVLLAATMLIRRRATRPKRWPLLGR